MKKSISLIRDNILNFVLVSIIFLAISALYIFKLGNLLPAFGPEEHKVIYSVYGLTGFFNHIFFLPIELVRSLLFAVFIDHGYFISRLPNALFGIICVSMFAYIIYQWHGKRTAVLTTLMFGMSAWQLHISRIASYDIMFAFSVLSLIFIDTVLRKHKTSQTIFMLSCFWLGLISTVPGMIWFVLLNFALFKDNFSIGWQNLSSVFKKIASLSLGLFPSILLLASIIMNGGFLKFLGAPNQFDGLLTIAKNFLAAPVHLFIRGPQYPEIWLDQAPVLDVFVLLTFVLGLYFYITHKEAARSKMLLLMLLLSLLLVGLGGPVSLAASFVIVLLISATGITFLLKEWLTMFPINPIARSIGIGMIIIAVAFSCAYSIRSYFVAWPNNSVTKEIFIHKK